MLFVLFVCWCKINHIFLMYKLFYKNFKNFFTPIYNTTQNAFIGTIPSLMMIFPPHTPHQATKTDFITTKPTIFRHKKQESDFLVPLFASSRLILPKYGIYWFNHRKIRVLTQGADFDSPVHYSPLGSAQSAENSPF